MNTITLTIPSNWLEGETLSQDELRQALKIGLAQLRQQQITQETEARVIQAFLTTGRVNHLSIALAESAEADGQRQPPPELPGPPVSEILIAQRRGEL